MPKKLTTKKCLPQVLPGIPEEVLEINNNSKFVGLSTIKETKTMFKTYTEFKHLELQHPPH